MQCHTLVSGRWRQRATPKNLPAMDSSGHLNCPHSAVDVLHPRVDGAYRGLNPGQSLNGCGVVFRLLVLNAVQLGVHLLGPKAKDTNQEQQQSADNAEEEFEGFHYWMVTSTTL